MLYNLAFKFSWMATFWRVAISGSTYVTFVDVI